MLKSIGKEIKTNAT